MKYLVALLFVATLPAASRAQGTTHVLLVTGLSGEPQYARAFSDAASTVADAARGAWHVRADNIAYLSEDPAADPRRMTGKATRENVALAFSTLAQRVKPGDVVLVFLVGHGSGEMAASSVNLPGPDPTAADYATWLGPLRSATVVFVNAATGSGDFGPLLAGSNRIVITATKTAIERNESIFAGIFAHALTGVDADADKDGRVTVREAFEYARAQVAKAYESSSHLLTEHATIVDSTGLASRVAFGGAAASSDPRVTTLLGERRVLEGSVDSLRRVKASMDSTAYQSRLEELLLQIAGKTQAINKLQGGSPR